MLTHVLLITLLTTWCMSDHNVRFNKNAHTCVADNTAYTKLWVRSVCLI